MPAVHTVRPVETAPPKEPGITLEQLRRELKPIHDRLDGMDEKFSGMLAKLATGQVEMDKRLRSVEQDVKGVDKRLRSVEQDVKRTKRRV